MSKLRLVEVTVITNFYLDEDETPESIQREFDDNPRLLSHAMEQTGEYTITARLVDPRTYGSATDREAQSK